MATSTVAVGINAFAEERDLANCQLLLGFGFRRARQSLR